MPHNPNQTEDTQSFFASEQQNVTVQITMLDSSISLPSYHYPGDAGLDLRSAEDCTLEPFERKVISTGLKVAIPDGFAGLVLPRSGLAAKAGFSLVNSPGLIDSQYRGELCVIAINLDAKTPIKIKAGDRIAQLVITPVPCVSLVEVDTLQDTERSEKGFGSSGLA